VDLVDLVVAAMELVTLLEMQLLELTKPEAVVDLVVLKLKIFHPQSVKTMVLLVEVV